MKKIDRHVFSTTLLMVLGTLLLLSIIETFFTLLNELTEIGDDKFSMSQMLFYTLFDFPIRINRMIPMGLLLGSLIALGQLSAHNELTIMRVTGMSKFRVLWGAIVVVITMSVFSFFLTEIVIPQSAPKAEIYYHQSGSKAVPQKGFWAISNNRIMNVAALQDGTLKQISLFDIKDQDLQRLVTAPKALLYGKDWIMKDVKDITITPDYFTVHQIEAEIFPNLIDQKILDALSAEPENLSIKNLWRFIRYMNLNGLDSAEYQLAFWNKALSPMMNFVMLIIVAPLIFSQNRQANLGLRVFFGIMIGLVIYMISRMLSHSILILGYPPIAGAIIPIIVSLIIAFILFKFVDSR